MCKSIGKAELKQIFIFCTGVNCGLFLFVRGKKLFRKECSYSQTPLLVDCCQTQEDYCKIVAEMFCHYSSKQLIVVF